MATSDTQSTYVSRFSPSEDITNFVCDQHDSEDLESLGFNTAAELTKELAKIDLVRWTLMIPAMLYIPVLRPQVT